MDAKTKSNYMFLFGVVVACLFTLFIFIFVRCFSLLIECKIMMAMNRTIITRILSIFIGSPYVSV